ncbi:hypothetical protein [Streptobacillus canis]|uniref:hypothetical protein n=1 Tax=Streptobacillus canis TaxID=2678686 RepID=UPI0012E278A4|nr:hypothetical protein [Streptobacillus canis]
MDIVEQKISYGYSISNYNKYKNGMGYALFNIWGQWTDGNKVTQGKKEYVTDYAKVWLEAGLGANIPVTKNISSYFEVSLEKSLLMLKYYIK